MTGQSSSVDGGAAGALEASASETEGLESLTETEDESHEASGGRTSRQRRQMKSSSSRTRSSSKRKKTKDGFASNAPDVFPDIDQPLKPINERLPSAKRSSFKANNRQLSPLAVPPGCERDVTQGLPSTGLPFNAGSSERSSSPRRTLNKASFVSSMGVSGEAAASPELPSAGRPNSSHHNSRSRRQSRIGAGSPPPPPRRAAGESSAPNPHPSSSSQDTPTTIKEPSKRASQDMQHVNPVQLAKLNKNQEEMKQLEAFKSFLIKKHGTLANAFKAIDRSKTGIITLVELDDYMKRANYVAAVPDSVKLKDMLAQEKNSVLDMTKEDGAPVSHVPEWIFLRLLGHREGSTLKMKQEPCLKMDHWMRLEYFGGAAAADKENTKNFGQNTQQVMVGEDLSRTEKLLAQVLLSKKDPDKVLAALENAVPAIMLEQSREVLRICLLEGVPLICQDIIPMYKGTRLDVVGSAWKFLEKAAKLARPAGPAQLDIPAMTAIRRRLLRAVFESVSSVGRGMMLSADLVEAAWGAVDASDVLEDSALFVSCGRSQGDRKRSALLIEPLSHVLRISDWSAMRGQLNRASVTLDRVGSNGCMLLALYGGARLLLEVQQRCSARRRLTLISVGLEESERQGTLAQIDAVLEECSELQRQVNPWTDQAQQALWSVCEESGASALKSDGRLKAYIQIAPNVINDRIAERIKIAKGQPLDHAGPVAEKRVSLKPGPAPSTAVKDDSPAVPNGASDSCIAGGATSASQEARISVPSGRPPPPAYKQPLFSPSTVFNQENQQPSRPPSAGDRDDMPWMSPPKRRGEPKSNNTWIRRNLRRSLTVGTERVKAHIDS